MGWDDGIGEDGTRILLPRCGITYKQIIDAAAEKKTLSATAKRLGVGETTLRSCVLIYGLSHCFEASVGPRCPTKLTRRRLTYWLRQGMTRRDIAEALGCSYTHLNVMIRRHNLESMN